MEVAIALLFAFWFIGQWVPWLQLRSRGLSISKLEYFSPFIQKNVFAYAHNKTVFDVLQVIRDNDLDISFRDLEKMYNSNVDFQKVVSAFLMVKTKGIKVSNDNLKELAYFSKDLMAVVGSKKPGEEIRFADALGKTKSF